MISRKPLAALFFLATCVLAVPSVSSAGPYDRFRPLKTIRLPVADHTKSGSLAFDGSSIYYAPISSGATSTIYRIDALTGATRATLTVDVPELWEMTYDGGRNHLYVLSHQGAMYDVTLPSLAVRKMFDLPKGIDIWWRWSYDAGIDGFRSAPTATETTNIGGPDCGLFCNSEPTGIPVITFSLTGALVGQCLIAPEATVFPSAILATGDTTTYIDDTDGVSLYHITSDCMMLPTRQHKTVRPEYNDALACDTVTFPMTVMWFRDGPNDTVTAYPTPDLNCPIPTRLAPVLGKDVIVNHQVTICTRLSLLNPAYPVRDQQVTLSADGKALATVQTDATGRACARYLPRQLGIHRLQANFAATRGYLASVSTGSLKALPVPVKPVRRRPASVTYDPPPQQPPQQLAPRPLQAPHVQTQITTQVQTQPAAQSQIQPQVAVVPQVQEQVQLARSTVATKDRELEFTRFRPRRRTPVPLLPLGAGAVAVAAMATAVAVVPALRRAEARRR